MLNCSESRGSGRAARFAVCADRCGLVRYYSWRTALCSRTGIDRLGVRRASDRNWLPRLQITLDQAPGSRARAI